MGKLIDLSNNQYGQFFVEGRAGSGKNKDALWLCTCSCGNQRIVSGYNLRSGRSKSCGCGKQNSARKQSTTHGGSTQYPKLYNVWKAMRARCTNISHAKYYLYGERGIGVCNEWLEFSNFLKWALDHGYADGKSIDRIDVNKGYCPDNCRWTDIVTQNNNKQNTRQISFNGESHSIAEWSRISNIHKNTIRGRLKRGLPIDRVLGQTQST